jgi:hypothetical protein
MNTDNLGVSGPGIGVTNDPYGHHHLTHPHLLPPHHSQHPSSIYCSSSNPYTELFSPFSTDFVTPHDTGTNTGVPTDYLTLQNSLDYVVSHHHHQQQQHHHQQQQQHHQHHQMTTSSNGERTPSSVGTGITGSDSSPSHSFGTSSGYSSSADYYNTSVLTSKTGLNNTHTLTTNTSNNNTSTTNTSSHSPYDGTSTASTSSPPQSTGGYLTTTVKQETMMPGPFAIDPHSNYGTSDLHFFF